MLIKTVSTVVTTDSTGKPIDALPVRTASAGETDAAGRPVDIIQVTEDPKGVPVRFVAGKAAQNSAGQWIDTIPVQGGGGGVPATGRLIETYDSLTGFTVNSGTQTAMSLVTSGVFEGAGAIEMDALAGVSGASGEVAVYKMGKFDVTTDTLTDIGLTVSLFYIDPWSEGQINSAGAAFGKVSGAMAGALASCGVPWGYFWAATHVSQNATLQGLGAGTYGVKPAARGNTPFGQKLRTEVTVIKADAIPTLVMGCDDCLSVQDAHFQKAKARGLKMYRAIPSANAVSGNGGNTGFSTTSTLLADQASGFLEIIANATRNDQPVGSGAFNTRALAKAEMLASKADLAAMGFKAAGLQIGVWPNGICADNPTKYAVTFTGNGTDGNVVISVALNAGVLPGMAFMGSNVPRGTTIVSIDPVDRTKCLLSNIIPAVTRSATIRDISGEFALDTFINDVAQANIFKMVRATGANRPVWPWYGPAGNELLMTPGDSWTTATASLVQTNVGLTQTVKGLLFAYWHGDWPAGEMDNSFDWIAGEVQAQRLLVSWPSEVCDRIYNGHLPLAA